LCVDPDGVHEVYRPMGTDLEQPDSDRQRVEDRFSGAIPPARGRLAYFIPLQRMDLRELGKVRLFAGKVEE